MVRSQLVMQLTQLCSSLSKDSRLGWPAHGDARSVCISFGALNDPLSSGPRRRRRAAAADVFVTPPPPAVKRRRAAAAAADV